MRAQGQDEIAISLAKYIIQNYELNEEASDVYRLVGKWLAETRASKLYSKFIYSKNLFCVPSLCFINASFLIFFKNCFARCVSGEKCSSRTILEKYLKPAVSFAEDLKTTNKKSIERQSQTHFHLAHYADALFRSYEERLTSTEWQAAMRLRKHKVSDAC